MITGSSVWKEIGLPCSRAIVIDEGQDEGQDGGWRMDRMDRMMDQLQLKDKIMVNKAMVSFC